MNDSIIDIFLDEIRGSVKPLPIGDVTVDRLPVVFAIDCSESTKATGDINQINECLRQFADNLAVASPSDSWGKIRRHIDIGIVSYADKAIDLLPWTPAENLTPSMVPTLVGAGTTSMAAGLLRAADMMLKRLADYRNQQVHAYRGYIFNVTDGLPTDMADSGSDPARIQQWNNVKEVLDRFETIGRAGNAYASTFHFASRAADRAMLSRLAYAPDRVVDLHAADFAKFLEFVRISLVMNVSGLD